LYGGVREVSVVYRKQWERYDGTNTSKSPWFLVLDRAVGNGLMLGPGMGCESVRLGLVLGSGRIHAVHNLGKVATLAYSPRDKRAASDSTIAQARFLLRRGGSVLIHAFVAVMPSCDRVSKASEVLMHAWVIPSRHRIAPLIDDEMR
jgi:hypothetical protein